jgi:flagellar protein FlaJ
MAVDVESLRLKARNYWRKNERRILLISTSFAIGVVLLVTNFVTYQGSQNKFSFEGEKTIGNQDENAVVTFNLEEPSLAQGTTIQLRFEGMLDGPPLDVFLNGQRVTQATSPELTLSPDPSDLRENNTIRVERAQIGFAEQALVSASVTSTTRFRQLLFVLTNLLAALMVAAPVLLIKYRQFQRKVEIEEEFPKFLRDILEGARAGMSLPQAVQNIGSSGYGAMGPEIEKMKARLDWGIPFDEVMTQFAEDSESSMIRRSVDTIIQAYESGGNIEDVLDSVVDNIRSIQELQQERESQLYGELVTGYIVYFIFIGILIGLTTYLLPSLSEASSALGGGGSSAASFGGGLLSGSGNLERNIQIYRGWFKNLAYIQAVFSGLIIGKLTEGNLRAGLKHVAILFGLGYLAVTFFL